MKTYINATASDIVISYDANGNPKSHTLRPGEWFTFDETEDNGPQIEQQLLASGAQTKP